MTLSLHETLLALETRVWQALATGDAGADLALLAPDFLGVYPSGFAGRTDHAGQLDAGPSVARYEIAQSRVLELAPGLAMLCYLARYCRTGADEEEEMYVSSLWRQEAEGWCNLFSQDTPKGGKGVP